jgi:hypothetical protein
VLLLLVAPLALPPLALAWLLRRIPAAREAGHVVWHGALGLARRVLWAVHDVGRWRQARGPGIAVPVPVAEHAATSHSLAPTPATTTAASSL